MRAYVVVLSLILGLAPTSAGQVTAERILPAEGFWPGIEFEVPAQNKIIVKGIDKELVGQTAARIRAVREPEPYKGKGIRYENERIMLKEGKSGKKK